MNKKIFALLTIALLVLLMGCKKTEVTTKEEAEAKEPVGEPVKDTIPYETESEEIIVTTNPDEFCFLSPCDCNCYVIGHVPETAKSPVCGSDCEIEYGITGCEFKNNRCNTVKG
jgi:hypothetical protein